MDTIRIPTDQDLQNYPHVFFTSPDIWDASVLDHEITPSLLEDINQHSDDSLLQDSIFVESGDLHHRAIQTLNIFCDLPSLSSGEPLTHAYMHDSNPAEEDWKSLRPYFGWQSEQFIKSHQDLEEQSHNMITSRSTSSPGILFSTFPGEMRLLPLTPSSVTHQQSMMVVLWPNSSLDEILWYVMPMASKPKTNS